MKKTTLAAMIVMSALFTAGCETNPAKGTATADSSARKAVKVSQTSRGALISSDERMLFDTGRFDIKPDGKVLVDRVATILKTKTRADVLVEGHTDNVGSAAANQQLSERRATAVRTALIQAGVEARRITARGMGMNQPVADNATADGRQANRRVDITALGENVDNIGGTSLGDRLQEGIATFLKDAGNVLKSVFGSGS